MLRILLGVLALAVGAATPGASAGPPLQQSVVDAVIADIDAFWRDSFAAADRPYRPPAVVSFHTPTGTACGRISLGVGPGYCPLDETIYYNAEFRALGEDRLGDFAWVTIVAHEWGHHVQAELGLYASAEPEEGEAYPVELELQADCLAGAYAQDAEARGWLEADDPEEAVAVTAAAGDPDGTAWEDPAAHGTAEQRVAAWEQGYAEGLPGCDLAL